MKSYILFVDKGGYKTSYSYDYFPKINRQSVKNRKGEIDVKKLVRLASVTNRAKERRRIMENVRARRIKEQEDVFPEDKKSNLGTAVVFVFLLYCVVLTAMIIKAIVMFVTICLPYIVGLLFIGGSIKLLYHLISKIIEVIKRRQYTKNEVLDITTRTGNEISNVLSNTGNRFRNKRKRNVPVHRAKRAKIIVVIG